MAPVSSVSVTCIPRQCLVIGQLGDGFLARDQDGRWEGALPNAPISSGSFPPLHGRGFGLQSGDWLQTSGHPSH